MLSKCSALPISVHTTRIWMGGCLVLLLGLLSYQSFRSQKKADDRSFVLQRGTRYHPRIDHSIRRVEGLRPCLSALAIGGTAGGTGLNCHPELPGKVVQRLCDWTQLGFRRAENRFEALAARDAAADLMGERCVGGITFNHLQIREMTERSLTTVTALIPEIGYDVSRPRQSSQPPLLEFLIKSIQRSL